MYESYKNMTSVHCTIDEQVRFRDKRGKAKSRWGRRYQSYKKHASIWLIGDINVCPVLDDSFLSQQ